MRRSRLQGLFTYLQFKHTELWRDGEPSRAILSLPNVRLKVEPPSLRSSLQLTDILTVLQSYGKNKPRPPAAHTYRNYNSVCILTTNLLLNNPRLACSGERGGLQPNIPKTLYHPPNPRDPNQLCRLRTVLPTVLRQTKPAADPHSYLQPSLYLTH